MHQVASSFHEPLFDRPTVSHQRSWVIVRVLKRVVKLSIIVGVLVLIGQQAYFEKYDYLNHRTHIIYTWRKFLYLPGTLSTSVQFEKWQTPTAIRTSKLMLTKCLVGTKSVNFMCPVLKVDLFFEERLLSNQNSYNTWQLIYAIMLENNLKVISKFVS